MPSGRTHDRITLWSLPAVAGLSFSLTRNGNLTLLIATGFLFGGLMFGPDLDIHSRQYQRWGWLRWIWQPYQHNLRHRSFLSHGPIIGTALRVFYLASWIAALWIFAAATGKLFWGWHWNRVDCPVCRFRARRDEPLPQRLGRLSLQALQNTATLPHPSSQTQQPPALPQESPEPPV